MDLTHASFFSGVGGLDLGLERAGWRTVSLSEIDPYACAVLAQRWPGVENVGDVVALADPQRRSRSEWDGSAEGSRPEHHRQAGSTDVLADREAPTYDRWPAATLWSGGFPCQDLSVAGKRRGLAGERSGLAFAFLGLVERHRPRLVLLENVPGLLSSHRGKDLLVLTGRLAELGYGWAFRVLDAQFFGVPQRRRRVFILGVRSEDDDPDGRAAAERAAEILAVGASCGRDHQEEREARAAATGGVGGGVAYRRARNASEPGDADRWEQSEVAATARGQHGQSRVHDLVVDRPPPDADRVRAPDGLAGRLDGRGGLGSVGSGDRGPDDNDARSGHLVYVKRARAQSVDDDESWGPGDVSPTINAFDVGDTRATALAVGRDGDGPDLDPPGLDSHRYRVCGNGVVAPVAEWLGWRLRAHVESTS